MNNTTIAVNTTEAKCFNVNSTSTECDIYGFEKLALSFSWIILLMLIIMAAIYKFRNSSQQNQVPQVALNSDMFFVSSVSEPPIKISDGLPTYEDIMNELPTYETVMANLKKYSAKLCQKPPANQINEKVSFCGISDTQRMQQNNQSDVTKAPDTAVYIELSEIQSENLEQNESVCASNCQPVLKDFTVKPKFCKQGPFALSNIDSDPGKEQIFSENMVSSKISNHFFSRTDLQFFGDEKEKDNMEFLLSTSDHLSKFPKRRFSTATCAAIHKSPEKQTETGSDFNMINSEMLCQTLITPENNSIAAQKRYFPNKNCIFSADKLMEQESLASDHETLHLCHESHAGGESDFSFHPNAFKSAENSQMPTIWKRRYSIPGIRRFCDSGVVDNRNEMESYYFHNEKTKI